MLYFARLGDMVMLTALLDFLNRRFHLPAQVIGAGPWNAEMYLENPDVSRLWWFGRHFPFPLTLAWPSVARALRESHPGPIYICEHHYRQLPRIKRMLSFAGVDPGRCVFINENPGTVHHSVDRLIRLGERTPPVLKEADYPIPTQQAPWAPRLCVLNADRVDLQAWLTRQNWAGRPIILVQPGNHRSMSRKRKRWKRLNTDNKAWPTERWITLLQKVHARMPDALIMLRGTDEEVGMLREIQQATGLDCVVVASVYLRRRFALCEYSHSIDILVDTGPGPRGCAALGLPSVGDVRRRGTALLGCPAQSLRLTGDRCRGTAALHPRGPDPGGPGVRCVVLGCRRNYPDPRPDAGSEDSIPALFTSVPAMPWGWALMNGPLSS